MKEKTEKELQKMLIEARDKVREMRFKVSQRQLKKVSDVKKEKKVIAQILTELNKRKNNT